MSEVRNLTSVSEQENWGSWMIRTSSLIYTRWARHNRLRSRNETEREQIRHKQYWYNNLQHILSPLAPVDVQHAHSMGAKVNKAHLLNKPLVFSSWKSLSENIGHLISHWDVFEFDITFIDTFLNKMMMNPNVLHLCMKGRCMREKWAMAQKALAHLGLMRRTREINEAQSEGTNSL